MEKVTRPPTILVVDDDPGLLFLIASTLSHEKWTVTTVASGAEGLAWLRQNSADLLLLDLRLRDIEGEKLIDTLADEGRQIPFVIITGQGDERVAVEMMKRGALDYVVKEVNFMKLLPTIVRRALALIDQQEQLRAAQRAVRESAEHYRALVEMSPDAIFVNRGGIITFINAAGLRLFGATEPRHLIGKSPFDFFHKDDHEVIRQKIESLLETTGTMPLEEYKLVRLDGEVRSVEVVAAMFPQEGGSASQVVLRDITERKQAEEALRVSEERYRTLFTTLIEGFCIIELIFDAQGRVVDYRFVEVNPAFEQQTGLHDAQGRLMRDLAPDHEAHWFEIYGQIALTGEPVRFVNEARALNRWFDVSAFRFGGAKSRKVAILSNDITERKRLENEILEISEREQRKFGHDMHDGLGQRLTGLEMLSHGLAKDLKCHAPALAKQAQRLNSELRETVTQARLISHSLAPVPLEGEGLMQGLSELAASTSRIPGVQCRFHCNPPVQIQEVTPATHLYRIAQEAVNNALKHGKARKVDITLAGRTGGVELIVENNGRAIPAANRVNSGMGLNFMRYRAQMIGATLSIESGKRKGVRVTCILRRKA